MRSETRQRIINVVLVPVLAIIAGLLVAAGLVLFTDTPPLEAYAQLFRAGFGCEEFTRCAFFTTLERATPLILTGLATVVAFRSGMFSIGQEGQLLVGSVMAAWLGFAVGLPPILHALFVIAGAMIGGGIYGWIPGVLKVRLGVNEIISTIVMNNIAILATNYIVNFPLRADRGTTAHSPVIDETAWLAVFVPGSKWGTGFVLALLMAAAVYVYLWRSAAGFEQRMAGQAPFFALFGGIRNDRAAIRSMFLSGALCGLAGAVEVLGVHHRIMQNFSTGLGFDGLMVAILGQSHPIGVVIVAIFFAGVRLGAQIGLQLSANIPRELGGGIIALMILFVAAERFFQNNIDGIQGLVGRLTGRDSVEEGA